MEEIEMTLGRRIYAPRRTRTRYLTATVGALALGVVLTACSGGSAQIEAETVEASKAPAGSNGQISDSVTQGVQREAAQDGEWPLTKSCPVQDDSYDLQLFITNWLPRPMTLQAGNLDCYDWSGDKTPPTVLNGQTLTPGQTRQFTLRVRGNTDRNWMMRISTTASSETPAFESQVFRVQNPANTEKTFIATTGSFRCGSVAVGATTDFYPQAEPGKAKGFAYPIQFWSNGSQVMGTVPCP
jgi:hypothetical protein